MEAAKAVPDRELEFSPLSGRVTRDGVTVQVHIYRFVGTDDGWTLEVVDHDDGSTVWEGSFDTDVEAYEAFWAEKGYEVRGRTERSRYLEQPPGPKNPLGKVKLIFENRNSVYLHDTPGKRLFGRARRAYSHGCLRLQDPVGLAEQLLKRDGTWGDVLDAGALEHWRETPVHLISPIPIVVEYQLASAGPDGVRFFWDVYARSKRHAR